MNILVTGAWGQLGSWLRILASASSDRFVFTDVAQAGEEQLEMLGRLGGGKQKPLASNRTKQRIQGILP